MFKDDVHTSGSFLLKQGCYRTPLSFITHSAVPGPSDN